MMIMENMRLFGGQALLLLALSAAGIAGADDAPAAAPAIGALRCAPVFADNAVLQRNLPVPIWGQGKAGSAVTVRFAGQEKSTTAGTDGRWRLALAPLTASDQPQVLQVSDDAGRSLSIANVVVGDVWICSGQSNMAGKVRINPVEDKSDNLMQSDFPNLRQSTGTDPWLIAKSPDVAQFTRVGFCFGREIHRQVGIPIGLLHVSVGGTPIEAWLAKRPEALGEVDPNGRPVIYGNHYDTLVAPLVGYGIRGVIWYQGEGNANEGQTYLVKMKTLIETWRAAWGQGAFPFYYVQIAAIGTSPDDNPAMGDGRARIREAQRRVLQLPNTGMATAIDNGGEREHPHNKKEVGVRLAQWALNRDYGKTDVVPSGPLYKGFAVEGATIRVRFDYGDGLLIGSRELFQKPVPAADGRLPWLSIQDSTGAWHWAEARIDGSDLLVSSPAVTAPTAVRYAYTNRPLGAYLYNAAGLPASPFTTEAELAD